MDAQKTRGGSGRDTRTQTETEGAGEGGAPRTHARTHTGMKFSDTSFARWRHQVRRTRSCRTWEGGEKGLMMVAERVGGSVIKLMIVE